MKILHTSDIHLKEYKDERWDALMTILDVGKKEDIDLLLISGDLFDKNYKAEELRNKLRGPFSNNGFKIIAIPGNHDNNLYEDGYVFGNDITIIRKLQDPLIFGEVAVWGLPFENLNSEKVYSKLFSIKDRFNNHENNILLFHGDVLDLMYTRSETGDEGRREYMPIKFSFFNELNIQYILAGHFHSNFGVWEPVQGTYFVYPGSPVSITKKETGVRKVNLFECGDPPKEYQLTTPYYEDLVVDFNPLKDFQPKNLVEKELEDIPSQAKICLNLKGFLNSEKIEKSEKELIDEIKNIYKDKCFEIQFNFQDINIILKDDLFIKFSNKLKRRALKEEEKKRIQKIVINALLRVIK